MAVVAGRATAGNPAQKLAENTRSTSESDQSIQSFLLRNVTKTAPVYLGPSGVDATTGTLWDVTDPPLSIDLEPGESLYGYATASQTIHRLKTGR